MNKQEALDIISRYYPCPHSEWTEVGYGQDVKCEICGDIIAKEMLPSHEKKFTMWHDAFELLRKE